jgi:uncharacterized HAD superfamily protein
LNETIIRNLHKIPTGTEVIAGVHRSGQLAAQIIGAHLNLPVISYRNLRETSWIYAGYRSFIETEEQEDYLSKPRKVLVVEDAVTSGQTLLSEKVKYDYCKENLPDHKLTYLAVYPAYAAIDGIDISLEVVPGPRLFEWNWLNHGYMIRGCVSIDGLLCQAPTEAQMDESEGGQQYKAFVDTAKPLHVPKRRLLYIVTSRMLKWKTPTKLWLKRNKITYGQLHMMPVSSATSRHQYGAAKYKAEMYQHLKGDTELFFEANPEHAAEIFKTTKRPVYCTSTKELLQDGQ